MYHALVHPLLTVVFMLSIEAANINFIVFDLIRPRLEPMIYHTQGEHAYYYCTPQMRLRIMIKVPYRV